MNYFIFIVFLLLSPTSLANNMLLPSVPYPVENPPTEAKRILGKILFWDEQLSTDNSIACGTCHIPSSSGSDNRIGINAGFDKRLNTSDDIFGSLGVITRNNLGQSYEHPIYQFNKQVTGRTSQPYFNSLWSSSLFWDGRAHAEFLDPQTKQQLIHTGGALENQVLGPLMSDVEMAKKGRTAADVINKLNNAKPLVLAQKRPEDIGLALKNNPSYPQLFRNAFGDNNITLSRIAFAIATYERSLVSNQTPWDIAMANNTRLPYLENLGWEVFKQHGCNDCHIPPMFTDNKFYNIGIQGQNADIGHAAISKDDKDIGSMKTPSLRNIVLKKTFTHTGQFTSLDAVIDAYAKVPFKNIASKKPNGENYEFQFSENQRKALLAFLTHSLTDPRVQQEKYPFDRPQLRQESPPIEIALSLQELSIALTELNQPIIMWSNQLPHGFDIEIVRSDGKHWWLTQAPFIDQTSESNKRYAYIVNVRTPQLQVINQHKLSISTAYKVLWFHILFVLITVLSIIYLIRKINTNKC